LSGRKLVQHKPPDLSAPRRPHTRSGIGHIGG
jgi:hypothetical protein